MKSRHTIYVVDRDNVNLRIITRKLQRELNCKAYGFSSPESCLIAMERRLPDMVLADCGQETGEPARMTSAQMLIEIKKDYESVPVIMYTSISSMELAVQMMRTGASNVIPKQVFFFQKIVQAVQDEFTRMKERYHERRTKLWLLLLVVSVVGITLYFNLTRQEWLMYFMLGALALASLFVFWERREPASHKHTGTPLPPNPIE